MRFTLPLLVLGVVSAQLLTVEEPSTAHWWVANSLNTLRWTGQSSAPTTFSVFLANGNTALLVHHWVTYLTEEPLYEYAKTVNPGGITPGQGYTIELTDTLNSSNIYATSQTFEIKAEGSAYPPQTTIDPSATVSGSSNPAAPSGSGAAASPSPTGGAEDLGVTAWPAVLAGTVAIGFAALW